MNRENILNLLNTSKDLILILNSFNEVLKRILDEEGSTEVLDEEDFNEVLERVLDEEEDCGGYRGDGCNDPDNIPGNITSDYFVQPSCPSGYYTTPS